MDLNVFLLVKILVMAHLYMKLKIVQGIIFVIHLILLNQLTLTKMLIIIILQKEMVLKKVQLLLNVLK